MIQLEVLLISSKVFFHAKRKTPKWGTVPVHVDTNANKKYSDVKTTDVANYNYNKNNQKIEDTNNNDCEKDVINGEMSYKISSILPKSNHGSMQKYLEFVVTGKSTME